MKRHSKSKSSESRKRARVPQTKSTTQTKCSSAKAIPVVESENCRSVEPATETTSSTALAPVESVATNLDKPISKATSGAKVQPETSRKVNFEIVVFTNHHALPIETGTQLSTSIENLCSLATRPISSIKPVSAITNPTSTTKRPSSTKAICPRPRVTSTTSPRICQKCHHPRSKCSSPPATLYKPSGFSNEDWDTNNFASEPLPDWIIPLEVPVVGCTDCGLWASAGYCVCAEKRVDTSMGKTS